MSPLRIPASARLVLLTSLVALTATSIAGMQIVAGLVALGFLLSGGPRFVPIRARVLMLAAWCALSVLLSPAQFGTFLPTAWLPVLLVWVVAGFAEGLSESALEGIGTAWVTATTVTSAWAIVQAYTGLDLLHLLHLRAVAVHEPLTDWPGHWAASGFFPSRLTYAHALLVPLGIASATALRGSGRTRLLAALATILLGTGLVLSFARAAWWGALSIAAILILATRARRAALGAIAAVLVLGLALPSVRARFLSGTSVARNTDRVFIWNRAAEVIADHPLLGVGFGAYPQVAAPYYDRASPIFPMRTWCHDTPLSLLAELGPLGLGLYGCLWLSIFALGWRAVRQGSTLALGLLAGTCGLHVASLFHDILYNAEVAYALFLGGALLVALGVRANASPSGALSALQDFGRGLLFRLVRLAYPLPPSPAPPIDLADVRKVLVVRIDTRVGNVLLTTPLLRALRRGLPQARVDVWVARRNLQLVEELADRVLPFRKEDFFQAPWRFGRAVQNIRRERYDVVIEAGHWHAFSFTSLWLAHVTGARVRIGHDRGEAAHFLTHAVRKDPTIVREVPSKLELLGPLGIPADGERLDTTVDRGVPASTFADHGGGRPVVTLNPGARKADHRWAPEAYGALAARLHDELQLTPIVAWGPGEEAIAQNVVASSGGKAKLAPPTNLPQLAALFRASALVVTNDTGPMHLAVATGAPVLAILLADDGARWSHVERFQGVAVHGASADEVARVVEAARAMLAPPT